MTDIETDEVGGDGIPENEPAIQWVWSQGWKGKLDVIFVTLVVILLSITASILKAWEDAYERNFGRAESVMMLIGFLMVCAFFVETLYTKGKA